MVEKKMNLKHLKALVRLVETSNIQCLEVDGVKIVKGILTTPKELMPPAAKQTKKATQEPVQQAAMDPDKMSQEQLMRLLLQPASPERDNLNKLFEQMGIE